MSKSGTPMLFLPPLPPSQLPTSGCFVVGRSRIKANKGYSNSLMRAA